MKKIEHIGIAVKDLQKANDLYRTLFGSGPYKEEEVASEGVKTSFFQTINKIFHFGLKILHTLRFI